MSIITISRGSYSRGKEVAEKLARKLGYECISRDIIVEASDQFNIPEIKLIRALHDAPSLLNRFSHGEERYIQYVKSSFLKHMRRGNIVYHGLAGHFFLQDIPHVLKVRISAKMSDRVAEEMKREACTEAEALNILQKDDKERRKWSQHLYGKDTWDSRLYDLVLCIDLLTVDDVVETLADLVKKKQFQETEESRDKLKRMALLANIHALVRPISPKIKVNLRQNSCVEFSNIDGSLKNGKHIRQDLEQILKDEVGVQEVYYREPIEPYRGHINNFYNIDVN